ncbi:hypothetical protein BSL78_30313 [Apostichopus japonicus]|uniref:Pigment-dispersing factor-like 2 n=1 Tax=Stichopus japonicus TaxID=307972 RepID=A0A2G8JAV3_STIJA|nr:pigment-dispersing factor-like precursor 2 [Apostichopus japonicus]PIK32875.1 hypothetical protein BSL78_30313 [Apostichopus japonicus]
MQKILVLIVSVLVILLGLAAATEALPVKRISDNDFAQLRGPHISQFARNKAFLNRQRNALEYGQKRDAMSADTMDKRNLSQNDVSQSRAAYMNQMLAYRMMSQLLGEAGRR